MLVCCNRGYNAHLIRTSRGNNVSEPGLDECLCVGPLLRSTSWGNNLLYNYAFYPAFNPYNICDLAMIAIDECLCVCRSTMSLHLIHTVILAVASIMLIQYTACYVHDNRFTHFTEHWAPQLNRHIFNSFTVSWYVGVRNTSINSGKEWSFIYFLNLFYFIFLIWIHHDNQERSWQ